MNAPVFMSSSEPDGSLLSPPSSPEMAYDPPPSKPQPYLFRSAEGRIPHQSGNRQLADVSHLDREWIEQADTSDQSMPLTSWDYSDHSLPRTFTENPKQPFLFTKIETDKVKGRNTGDQAHASARLIDISHSVLSQKTPQPPLSFESPNAISSPDHHTVEEEGIILSPTSSEDGETVTSDAAPRTAAERRAEKRKMKRFRLVYRGQLQNFLLTFV